ncbi:MAG: cytochrome c biogenesis protein CcdA [Bacteroidales bacterium]
MQKRNLLILLFSLLAITLQAQIYDPVTWDFRYEQKDRNLYELIFTANIDKGFHIFSTDIYKDGPIPTSIVIDSLAGYSIDGKPYEVTKPEEVFDEAFGFKIKIFHEKAEFRQRIIGKSPSFVVKGTVNFGSCNNSVCSPPKEVGFEIQIGTGKMNETRGAAESKITHSGIGSTKKGILSFFLASFLLGLLGVITPCVYPMIPMTVAFFTRGSENRSKAFLNAFIFGLSIVIIYTSPGIIISLTGAGAGFANALSTHWIPNTIFFILFVLFAVSFFGAFEMVLPNKWANSADSKVDRGGLLAAFFMALTTVIVSFSCTGPIIGGLLVEAARGDVLRPTVGMFAFGLAFALPFTLFALFPALLTRLPKSGGWLNSIKVVLGFLMLAFSMKFLMTIDSVYSLGLLSRDLYLAVWIVLFSLLGLYLMGKIKFAHDSNLGHIGPFRLFLIIAVFSFVLYLIPGLFGAPLKGVAALLPPQETSWFTRHSESPENKTPALEGIQPLKVSALCSEPKYKSLFEMPLGLQGYFDLKQGLACAREQGKPALIDFKGHACANCKRMEAKVWSDPDILKRLRENFVIISLYADDRTELPENEWFVSSIDGKMKKTIGKQNEDIEITRFSTNALPLYVISDYDGKAVISPMPTNLNAENYKNWLDDGLKAFNSGKK